MKTVGAMLQEARESKGLTPTQVESAIKIRERFIIAIEHDEFSSLPSLSYAKGFVRNYAEFLGLPIEEMMAFFRRQTLETPKSSLLPHGVTNPLNTPFFQLTPSRFLTILVSLLLVLFFSYLGFQYSRINASPSLHIDAPIDKSIVTQKRITVEGKTDPDATVTINGVSTVVRNDGRFFEQIAIDVGVNKIQIISSSRFGKTTTVVKEVGLQQ